MVIDIFFILMATFGFYFGFSFGLMWVVLLVFSLAFAALAAMRFTETTADLIGQTFEVESPFLPFLAFLVTLIVLLMMARMVAKFTEELISNERFDLISQIIGGLLMSLTFTLLYSVLVTFFGQAQVLNLIFNQEMYLNKDRKEAVLMAVDSQLEPNPKDIKDEDLRELRFGNLARKRTLPARRKINFATRQAGKNRHKTTFAVVGKTVDIEQDTFVFGSGKGETRVYLNNRLACFCEGNFWVMASSDTIHFVCQDEDLVSKSATSFFYKYIELIPRKGTIIMCEMLPFVKHFIDYMRVALDRLNKGRRRPKKAINTFDTEDESNTTSGTLQEENVFDKLVDSVAADSATKDELPSDSIVFNIDTTNIPVIKPTPKGEKGRRKRG